MEHVQITYGAIILSFLGALHWGMEFARYGGEVGYERLIVGTVPVLLAWPTTFLTHGVALGGLTRSCAPGLENRKQLGADPAPPPSRSVGKFYWRLDARSACEYERVE
jgi:hypothetical protein